MKHFYKCKCGGELFIMQQRIAGQCTLVVDKHGRPQEEFNESIHDNLEYRNLWQFWRCAACGRRAKEIKMEG